MAADRWRDLLLEPPGLADEASFAAWFDRIASRLLCGTRFLVAGTPHRLTEVEFYYHGPRHLDPFSHRQAVQKGTAGWYFHRTAGVYRGGSFKGLDLTFGSDDAFGGVLFRGLTADGVAVDGPSLLVDRLLALTGRRTVAALDAASDVLSLEWADETPRELLKSARVGLSLRRMRNNEAGPRFLLRRYRYLSEPRRTAKGKLHMALALHADGAEPAEIRERVGVTNAALTRYLADYEAGKGEAGFDAYFGVDSGPRELARLHGLWQARYGHPISNPTFTGSGPK